MITAEYLRKRDLFTLYTTNQIDNFTEASTSWAASSPEGMIQYELCSRISFDSFVVAEISERVSLVNQCICLLNIIVHATMAFVLLFQRNQVDRSLQQPLIKETIKKRIY